MDGCHRQAAEMELKAMHHQRLAKVIEATRLTREGKLAEATAVLQGSAVGTGATDWTIHPPRRTPSRQRSGTPADGVRGTVTLEDLLSHLPHVNRRPGRSTPVEPAPRLPGRWLEGSHANHAGEREYRLYVPSTYSGQPVPLIAMLHGGTQTADDFAAGTRMNELAERKGFLVVYPEQSIRANPMRYWNWFQPAHQHRDTGEPSLIAGLTRQIVAEYGLESAPVYVAGFSAGAAMAAVMAACYPDLYAAVGVHSGLAHGVASDVASAFTAMKQGAPASARADAGRTPLIVFHGDDDPTVDHVNAECLVQARLRSMADPSAQHRALTSTGQVPRGHRYTRKVFRDSQGSPAIEQWSIHGGGHAWAGGSPRGTYTDPLGPDASAELVRFFEQHANDGVAVRRPRRSPSGLRRRP